MEFIENLRWRGMLHDITPGLEERLKASPAVGYIGFDPTAPSLGIGNFVQIMLLKMFQQAGHTPIVLMGGATGRIGDPSGKDTERTLKSYEELDANLAIQRSEIQRFLDFENVPNPAIIVNNHDFYKKMNVLDFLRDVGKNLTVNYMMSKESVKKRLESGISFTEFSYQLLQAYDFLCLYEQQNCIVQMGGSDQWGNITSGTEFIRRNIEDGKAYAVTTPLLTKSDGGKFGKSEKGNLFLGAHMTSPYKFYQFWINAADDDIHKFTRYFTLKSREEIEENERKYADDPRILKQLLAEELTTRVHSQEDYQSVLDVSEILFNKNASRDSLLKLSEAALMQIADEIPSFKIDANIIQNGCTLVDLITEHTAIVKSKGDARRAIQSNALAINKQKIVSHEQKVGPADLLHSRFIMVENGKKNKYLLHI
jgi:tyrosyl-tRNA synthetase